MRKQVLSSLLAVALLAPTANASSLATASKFVQDHKKAIFGTAAMVVTAVGGVLLFMKFRNGNKMPLAANTAVEEKVLNKDDTKGAAEVANKEAPEAVKTQG